MHHEHKQTYFTFIWNDVWYFLQNIVEFKHGYIQLKKWLNELKYSKCYSFTQTENRKAVKRGRQHESWHKITTSFLAYRYFVWSGTQQRKEKHVTGARSEHARHMHPNVPAWGNCKWDLCSHAAFSLTVAPVCSLIQLVLRRVSVTRVCLVSDRTRPRSPVLEFLCNSWVYFSS